MKKGLPGCIKTTKYTKYTKRALRAGLPECIKTRRICARAQCVRNTQNTQKKGLHVRFQHYEHKEMRCFFRNTRAAPTKSQRICEACKGVVAPRWKVARSK